MRLGVNIDHIATLRNQRNEGFPSVVEAALIAETNGADLITMHLREDRRHIKEEDVILIKKVIKTELNLEMAATFEMLDFAISVKPQYVCLVPEKREELTTEGGLNIKDNFDHLHEIIKILQENKIVVSLFINPNSEDINLAKDLNVEAIELHTGIYAQLKNNYYNSDSYYQLKDMAEFADSLGLIVNAGHGLNYHNVIPICKILQIQELNIGFSIVSQAILAKGLADAVKTMKQTMFLARNNYV